MYNTTLEFLITTTMELATLACTYLGVRLYKQSRKVRLSIIGVPLALNILCYAIYQNKAFFYMAIILIISIPFAWTRKSQ